MSDWVVVSEEHGRKVLAWMRDNSWTGGAQVYVSTRPYSGDIEPEWVTVERVVTGDAAPFPVRGRIPSMGGARAQWKLDEVLAVRVLDMPELRRMNPQFPWPEEARTR